MSSLLITGGPLAGRRVRLAAQLVVGRTADLSIEDPEISRQHARLTSVPGGLQVEDLDSTNGTWVNGRRITGPSLLRPSDQLRMGATTITFEPDEEGKPGAEAVPVFAPRQAFAADAVGSRRSGVASRRVLPIAFALAAIVATAVSLTLYFWLRA